MRKEARSDFDVIAERIVPFAVRGETRRKLEELKAECRRRLSNLEPLTDGGKLSCPLCGSAERVVILGNGRGGAKKFECRAKHDPALTRRKNCRFRFSTYTSREALEVYRDFLVEALTLLTFCEGTYEGIAKFLNVTKHVVEFSVAVLLDYLGKKGRIGSIEAKDDLVVVYADFSTTRVSRAASVVMSRAGGSVVYQVCCSVNYLTAWNFVRALRQRLALKPGAKLVFVTDGEAAWIDPIRALFPEAIHIRQFHTEASLGLVYVHFPFRGKLYTLRCLWDAVLNEGEADERVKQMRKRRRLESAGEPVKRTELFDGVILWEGTVREPRGTRRKGATVSGAMEGAEEGGAEHPSENGPQWSGCGRIRGFGGPAEPSPVRGVRVAPRTDGAKRIFKGSWEEALRIPAVRRARSVLVQVFGGLYITSNAAECLFGVKPSLLYHRTVKSGTALIHVVLFLKTRLRKLRRAEVKSFLANEVVTLERLRRVAVGGPRPPGMDERRLVEQTVLEAYRDSKPVVIHYRDAWGRRTSRMIEPLELEVDSYANLWKVRAHCYLRGAERTFLFDRIVEAIPVDTNISIISR
jgi:hypothetical protein